MRFSSLLALLSAPFLPFAGPNPFKIPSGGLSATGGKPLTLQWTPTTSGPITLVLRSGNANDLSEGTIIASSIPNSGSYTWTPSNSLTSGDDYAVEIIDDSDPSQVNYTPPFTLDTTTTQAQSTSLVTLGAPVSSIKSKAPTGSQTGPVPTPTSSSSSYTLTLNNPFTHTTLGSSSTSGLTTISHSPSSGSASVSPSMPGSTTSAGSAARATAMAVGIIGVALGALAI